MTLIVNGTEIENVIVVKRVTGESVELEKLQDQNENVIWEKQSAPFVQLMPVFFQAEGSIYPYYTYVGGGTYSSGDYFKYNKDTYEYEPITLSEGDDLTGLYSITLSATTPTAYAVGDGTNSCNVFNKTNIKIPSEYNGLPIIQIDSKAFADENILSISWGENMQYISHDSFDGTPIYQNQSNWENGCLKINNAYIVANQHTITIPEYIEILGERMCASLSANQLQTVYFNSNKIKNLSSLGAFVIENKGDSLAGDSQLFFGNNVTRIPSFLFKSGHVGAGTSTAGTPYYNRFVVTSLPSTIKTLEPFSLNDQSISDSVFKSSESSPFIIPSTITNVLESAGEGSTVQNIKIETERISNKMFYQGTYTKLNSIIISSNCKEIGNLAFGNSSTIKKITFEHPVGATISLPTAGSNSGILYYKSARTVSVYTDNESIKNYAWATDNVTATFYHLDGSAWA